MNETILGREVAAALREHEAEDDRRHEDNLSRFTKLEITAASLIGQMRMIIALLIANGAINIYSTIRTNR